MLSFLLHLQNHRIGVAIPVAFAAPRLIRRLAMKARLRIATEVSILFASLCGSVTIPAQLNFLARIALSVGCHRFPFLARAARALAHWSS